jgi:hypothetical protein
MPVRRSSIAVCFLHTKLNALFYRHVDVFLFVFYFLHFLDFSLGVIYLNFDYLTIDYRSVWSRKAT